MPPPELLQGRPDIVGFGDDGIWTALSNGDGTFQPARYVLNNFGYNQGWRVENHPRILADLTGDGRADVVGFGNDGVWTACATGDGGFQAERFVLADMGANQGWRVESHPRFLVDLTGNGRADIVGFGDAGVWTALGNGDGTFQSAKFVLADFGVEQGWSGDDHPRCLVDFDGDGKPDIVGFGNAGVWVALGNGDGTFQSPKFVLADFGRASNVDSVVRREVIRDHRPQSAIKHLFVLMLENRSYDHMLGFANLTGTDAATGAPTVADGLTGSEFNTYHGQKYPVVRGSPDVTVAPGHGFTDAREQLCGPFANYPDISNTGFIYSLARSGYGDGSGEIMRCFDPDHLPILTTLAREFAVCDRWFSSMPGPTEPNRYFLHAATSGKFDESPTPRELIEASTNHWGGMEFDGGTIFDALERADVKYRIYAGDHFPVAGELKGVSNTFDVREFHDLADDLQDEDFDARFIHIEPKYFDGILDTADANFGNGNSQHPSGSVAAGERLIQATYEAIRNSPVWESSLLIITYDEHGGFYDHVAPPAAEPTGSTGRKHGFKFDQLGARVPAVIVSPRIPKGTIEHRLLEHSSVIKTVCDQFDVPTLQHCRNLTNICGVGHLAHLSEPRTDTPAKLPGVVVSELNAPAKPLRAMTRRRVVRHGTFELPKHAFEDDGATADPADSMFAMSVRIAAMREIALEPGRKDEILARADQIQTASEAASYLREVESKLMHAP